MPPMSGLLYKPVPKFSLGAVAANIGSGIKFVDQSDPLPLAGRLGATYQLSPEWDISAEGVYRKTGLISGSSGLEWRCGEYFSFRGGYNTAHTKQLGASSGFTAGVGLFSGDRNFLTPGLLWETSDRRIISHSSSDGTPSRGPSARDSRKRKTTKISENTRGDDFRAPDESRYQNIYDFLNEDERKSVK